MATSDRSPRDIARARELGHKYGRLLNDFPLTLRYWRPALNQLRGTGQFSLANALLRDLVSEVDGAEHDRASAWRSTAAPALHVSARIQLTGHLESALRLLAFAREARLGGVLVAAVDGERSQQDELGSVPLFDVFNPRARSILGRMDEDGPASDLDGYAGLRDWARRAASSDSRITLVPQREASTGFMTLFADSVRSIVSWFRDSNASYVDYEFNSNEPGGLQVQYHPQYFTSPVVFGPKLSTPVSQRILIGHYYFLGQPPNGGRVIRDPTVFFASPSSTVGNTVWF
jgi:hypothetical protein